MDWQAATAIQAGWLGLEMRTRQRKQDEAAAQLVREEAQALEKRLGLNLQDPAVVAAATRIQAGFRGILGRRAVQQKRKVNSQQRNRLLCASIEGLACHIFMVMVGIFLSNRSSAVFSG